MCLLLPVRTLYKAVILCMFACRGLPRCRTGRECSIQLEGGDRKCCALLLENVEHVKRLDIVGAPACSNETHTCLCILRCEGSSQKALSRRR